MNNTIRNTLLAVIALGVVSLSARSFSGAATTTTSTAPARHYYLTKTTLNGNQALTACASGYHFASFTELLDPTVLTYNKTLGRSAADDGAGAPTVAYGWIRTGYASGSVPNGQLPTNCNLWTSDSAADHGEAVGFLPSLGFGNNLACDNSGGLNIGVWCVEN